MFIAMRGIVIRQHFVSTLQFLDRFRRELQVEGYGVQLYAVLSFQSNGSVQVSYPRILGLIPTDDEVFLSPFS